MYILKIILIVFVCCCCSFFALGATKNNDSSGLDFRSIRNVLQKDGLQQSAAKRTAEVRNRNKRAKQKRVGRFDIPGEHDFWTFMSEYWIVKNAAILSWDFKKPNYGIEKSFREFLEKIGYFEKHYKILFVNSPTLSHFALPANRGEYIFIVSIPFIRTLDLSKLEISIMLFEDMVRANKGFFRDLVLSKKLKSLIGSNFYKKTFDKKTLSDALKRYDEIIFDKGFSFQQQYEVTSFVGKTFKSRKEVYDAYLSMLRKIDGLVKKNFLYAKYRELYPSPELQLSWLLPKTKKKH